MSTTATLDEIAAKWRAIEEKLDDTGGEVTPEVDAMLAEFSLMEADKVDAYGHIITDLTGRAKATKEAVKQLAHRAATMEERAAWLERRVQAFADGRGLREVKGRVHTFGYKKHGGVAPLVVSEDVDPETLAGTPLVKKTYAWDKTALREAVSNEAHPAHAEAVVIAHIGERGETFRLK